MALLHKSPLARKLGIADMFALLTVTATLFACHILLPGVPWQSLVGWFYLILWVNKVIVTSSFGAAFPAVFGLSETGIISINPTWYYLSGAVLCILVIMAVGEAVNGSYIMAAIVVAASIACGRATIPPLIVAKMLAMSYDKQAGEGARRHE